MTDTVSNMDKLLINKLFEPGHTLAWNLLTQYSLPWEVLPNIGRFIEKIGAGLSSDEYDNPEGNVWIHKTATVAPTASIGKSVIICKDANIRHCAFIREFAIVGCSAVVGNSTELKNVILFDNAQVPHFNYVGDSILGYKAHMGAGAITSNVKSDSSLVTVAYEGNKVETGLKKFGAILGDGVEVGCNAVLNPGSIVGAGSTIYPLSFVRGFVPAHSIYKQKGEVIENRNSV